MKNQILILILTLSTFNLAGQSKNKYEKQKEESFIFLEPGINTGSLKFIQTFKCVSQEGDDIPSLLRAIRVEALKKGANSFKFNSFTRNDTTKVMTLILDAFLASQQMLELNSAMHEDNVVYIFCDDKFNEKEHSFKINGEKRIIKSGTYYRYDIKENTEVEINSGGFTGTTVNINWEIGKDARFISFTGFALRDSPHPSNMVGVGFTTGKINYISTNTGLLLTRTLKLYE